MADEIKNNNNPIKTEQPASKETGANSFGSAPKQPKVETSKPSVSTTPAPKQESPKMPKTEPAKPVNSGSEKVMKQMGLSENDLEPEDKPKGYLKDGNYGESNFKAFIDEHVKQEVGKGKSLDEIQKNSKADLGGESPTFDVNEEIKNAYNRHNIQEPNEENLKKSIMDRYSKLSDDQKKDFALNVFHYGTDAHDNPIGKFRDPYTKEVFYGDAENNYEDMSDYLLNNNGQMEQGLSDIIKNGATQEDLEKLFNEHSAEDLEPYDEEESNSKVLNQMGLNETTKNDIESMKSYAKKLHDDLGWPEKSHTSEESQQYEVNNIVKKFTNQTGENFKLVNRENEYGGSDSEGSWYYPTYELESDNYKMTVSFSGGYKQYVTIEVEPKEKEDKAPNQTELSEEAIKEQNSPKTLEQMQQKYGFVPKGWEDMDEEDIADYALYEAIQTLEPTTNLSDEYDEYPYIDWDKVDDAINKINDLDTLIALQNEMKNRGLDKTEREIIRNGEPDFELLAPSWMTSDQQDTYVEKELNVVEKIADKINSLKKRR